MPRPLKRLVRRIRTLILGTIASALRAPLLRYARQAPRDGTIPPSDGKVTFVIVSAWGMGGTIRAAHNLAGYLAPSREVEIISVFRRREEPFFGSFPAGVKVSALDDQRPSANPPGRRKPVGRRLLERLPSLLVPSYDRAAPHFNLWVDLQLVRRLRGRTGYLIGTRPGINVALSRLDLPGFVSVGQEQMHLLHHVPELRSAMRREYAHLDALAVLTQVDAGRYDELLDRRVPLAVIPNTVADMGPGEADPEARVVMAAGRLTPQKGFDVLVPAYAQLAHDHPDWRLKIYGSGTQEAQLRALIAEHGVEGLIELPGRASNLGAEMNQASTFVLSSRFEGFPLVLLEAMSKALAIVAFDCPTGPSDIVDDHRNGLLIPAMDVDALAAGIREMIEDAELRRRCGPAAAETARDFKMDRIGPRWEALLEELRAARAQGRTPRMEVADPAPAGDLLDARRQEAV